MNLLSLLTVMASGCSGRPTAREVGTSGAAAPDGAVQQVTAKHEGADRYPAVVAKDGFIWLFWSSTRRGQVDIWWMKQAENGAWEAPQRLTTSQRADDMPSAAVGANGGVWLCWSAYLGDRRNLYGCVHDGNADGQWSEPAPLTQGAQRDEAPALINWKDKLHLFWQSDRPWSETESRRWRIWQALWTQTSGLSEAKPVTDRWLPDKETAVVSGGERLRLFWRWQQHRTLTVDTGNSETRQRLSTFQDTTAYTYDCGRFDDSLQGYQYDNTVRYNRQTIGIFMLPDRPEETFQLEREWEWVGKALRQFLPIHVRAVYAIQLADADSYPTEKFKKIFRSIDYYAG
ncbi:MAG: hypothetical protein IPM76_16450 [Chloroflexi bacterium]|nr:hypothetical protein [Chloroflexota bacterium]